MTDLQQEEQVRQSIEHIAEHAAKKAVRETMLLLGIDIDDPIKAQRQFATLATLTSDRTAENLQFLDRWRIASDRVSDAGWRAFVKVIVIGMLGLLATMTREYWMAHIPWRF